MKQRSILCATVALITCTAPTLHAADGTIKIGLNAAMTGSYAEAGKSTRQGADLAMQEINAAGGVKVGDKTYKIEMVYGDNQSNRSAGTTLALDHIVKNQVLAIVGPQSSDRAIAVGELANAYKTPMVTPKSTNPLTTLNRPYVFRMSFLDGVQVVATTKYAAKAWHAKKAAVLYNIILPYPSNMAHSFKKYFEEVNGAGSVVAFESFRRGDTDFSKQLAAILASGADFLYAPNEYGESALIVQQARKKGWTKPITGGDAWGSGNLVEQCGQDCNGSLFTGNFAATGVTGKAKDFVDRYQKAYQKLPDETATLTYDAMNLVLQAIAKTGGLSGDIFQDRVKVQEQLAATKKFEGVGGTIGYQGNGDPKKCVSMIKIGDDGKFTFAEEICP